VLNLKSSKDKLTI